MATSQVGIFNAKDLAVPAAAFLTFNWAHAYLALSSRTPKQLYGIDHNANPRQDLNLYAEDAIKAGKMTRANLRMIQRLEAASANSIDSFTFFATSILFSLLVGVRRQTLLACGGTYTLARIIYSLVYVFIEDNNLAQVRGLSFWAGNIACLWMTWRSALRY